MPSVFRATPMPQLMQCGRELQKAGNEGTGKNSFQNIKLTFLTSVGPFAITGDDVTRMGKSAQECAPLPEELGGGYMGTVEVFHQLHCLVHNNLFSFMAWSDNNIFWDLIRKYTYLGYYVDQNPKYWETQ